MREVEDKNENEGYRNWPHSVDIGHGEDSGKHPRFRNYDARWYHVFDRFSRELTRLEVFGFGVSEAWGRAVR
jgi:hypothetical protein